MSTFENKTNQTNQESVNLISHTSKLKTPVILGKGTYGLVVKVLKNGTYMARKRIQKNTNEGIDHSAVRECTFLNMFNHAFIYKPYLFNISKHGTVDIYLPLAQTDLYKWILQTPFQKRYELLPKITYQMASVFSYIHQHNIIHRDVKPSNILVDDQFNFYLSDFGSSRFVNKINDKNISMNNLPGTSNSANSANSVTSSYSSNSSNSSTSSTPISSTLTSSTLTSLDTKNKSNLQEK